MNFGKLNKKIAIWHNTATGRDAAGQPSETWALLKYAWAAIDYRRGGEHYEAEKLTAYSEQQFILRKDTDITRKMRIIYNSKTFEIKAIEDLPEEYIRIIAEEKE